VDVIAALVILAVIGALFYVLSAPLRAEAMEILRAIDEER